MAIKLYNPRHLLRHGSVAMMNDAAAGHTVLLRPGLLTGGVRTEQTGNAVHFGPARGKVFKLVECTDEEIAALELEYKAQE